MSNILSENNQIKAMWAVLIGLMGWYLSFYFTVSFAPDLSILVSFAERMMQGELYSESYYDTNPPLSMIIFIPPVWISSVMDWPVYHVHFFYSLGFMGVSFALTALLLKRFEFIDPPTLHLLLMIFVVTQIFAPDRSIGDREHIIVLGLVPFMLAQLAITRSIALPPWLKYSALVFGTLGVLIKPHYVVFPALFFAHRLWVKRNLSLIKNSDFLLLASGVLIYSFVLVTLFSDYIFTVVPDVVELYLWQKHPMVWTESFVYGVIISFIFFGVSMSNITEKQYKILLVLCGLALCAFIPYILQAKALNYQRIPYLTFVYLVGGYGLYILALHIVKPPKAIFISVLVAGSVLYALRGVPIAFPTHEEFKNLPISKAITKHCDAPCNYVLWYDFSDIVHQHAVYHDAFHASRFTSNWFLPRIRYEEFLREEGEGGILTDQEVEILSQKYTDMVIKDYERFNPQIIMAILKDGTSPDIEFFTRSKKFQDILSAYQKVDQVSFQRMVYYPGYQSSAVGEPPISFDIYKRRDLIDE